MKKFLLTTLLFVLCAFGATAQTVEKFYFGVTGKDNADQDVKVEMTVYNDFHFVVTLPDANNSTLSAATADVEVRLTNVEGLDIEGTHTYTNHISTGVEGIQAQLSSKLSNAYDFTTATIGITVNDASFTYNIARSGTTITGTPSNSAAAKTAWSALMESIEPGTQSVSDGYFDFKKGSTFVIGDSRLTFVDDYHMDNASTAMKNMLNDATVVIETIEGANAQTFQLYLAEGSTLAMGTKTATVKKNMNLGVTGFDNFRSGDNGFFQYLKSHCTDGKTTIHALFDAFNDVIGMVNGHTLTVNAGEMKDALGFDLQLGDVNMDGYIDATDCSTLQQYLFTPETIPAPFNFWAADVNQDGIYDVTDLSSLVKIILDL